jgi:hypothetical protein
MHHIIAGPNEYSAPSKKPMKCDLSFVSLTPKPQGKECGGGGAAAYASWRSHHGFVNLVGESRWFEGRGLAEADRTDNLAQLASRKWTQWTRARTRGQ